MLFPAAVVFANTKSANSYVRQPAIYLRLYLTTLYEV
jgi:hypothetical protein